MKPNEAACRCTNGEHCSICCHNAECEHMVDREIARRIPVANNLDVYLSTRAAIIADIKRGARF